MKSLVTLDVNVAEIVKLHGEVLDAAKVSLLKAIRIGELLSECRQQLSHGEWLPWLRANFPFSDRTGRNYIRLHENRDRLKLETVSSLNDGYKFLRDSTNKVVTTEKPPLHKVVAEKLATMIGKIVLNPERFSAADLKRLAGQLEKLEKDCRKRAEAA